MKGASILKKDVAKSFLPENPVTRAALIAATLTSAGLLFLPWIVSLNGKPHADWQQFIGRFHPAVVHIPIGLILLVPVLEIAGAFRPALREAAASVRSNCSTAALPPASRIAVAVASAADMPRCACT